MCSIHKPVWCISIQRIPLTGLTPPHYYACPRMSNVICYDLYCVQWQQLRWEVIVYFIDIDEIDEYHCLHFLYIIHKIFRLQLCCAIPIFKLMYDFTLSCQNNSREKYNWCCIKCWKFHMCLFVIQYFARFNIALNLAKNAALRIIVIIRGSNKGTRLK